MTLCLQKIRNGLCHVHKTQLFRFCLYFIWKNYIRSSGLLAALVRKKADSKAAIELFRES